MQILRCLINSAWWSTDEGADEEHISADAFKNVHTSQNKLSVFKVNSDDDVMAIVAALASTKDYIDKVDYCLFDEGVLSEFGISHEQTKGATPVPYVNGLHLDLIALKAHTLCKMISRAAHTGKLNRVNKSKVEAKIRELISIGNLQTDLMKDSLRTKFEVI